MSTWIVGQDVIVRENLHRSTRDTPAKVVKVARKYVTVHRNDGTPYTREWVFHIDTGREKGEGTYLAQLFTAESLAEHDRHTAAAHRVATLTRNYWWDHNLSTDDLTRIADIIEGAGA